MSGLNKNILSIPFLVISIMILFGSSYRYVRIFYPEVNYFPYILELFLWLIVVLRLFFVSKTKINKIDFIMLLTLFLACISFTVLSLRHGLSSQLVFFATYALPLSVYFYVKDTPSINVHTLDRLIRIFTIFGLLLLSIEFYSVNYLNLNIFSFASYWESGGVEGFHASKTNYAFLGELTRPWGIMAMPQSTGSLFAALGIYFFSRYFFSEQVFRSKTDLVYLILSLLAVYISGSRTAFVIFALILVFIFRKRIAQLATSFIIGIMALSIFVFSSQVSFKGFSNIIPKFFDGLTIDSLDRLFDLFFGQGLNSVAGRVIIGIDENHLLNHLFYAGLFIYLALAFLTFLLLKIYTTRLSKRVRLNFPSEYRSYYMAYLLFIFTLILGALHYDPLMRYPSNVLVLTFLALISRDVLTAKDRLLR